MIIKDLIRHASPFTYFKIDYKDKCIVGMGNDILLEDDDILNMQVGSYDTMYCSECQRIYIVIKPIGIYSISLF